MQFPDLTEKLPQTLRMKTFKYITLTLLAIILWAVFIIYGISDGFILKSLSKDESPKAFVEATKAQIDKEFVGNMAMVLVENGKVAEQFFHSEDKPVHENTVFQMASVSKWVTSWGIMSLVQNGQLDLDQPVDDYLTRWHLPASDFDNSKVTVRRILSHSAGLVDDLGYEGFGPDETVQSLEESLTKAADAGYSDGVTKVGIAPGTQYMYSGGGYTLLQLLIEEVSGQSFQDYMTETVFKPLGMNNSTFDLALRPDLELATLYKSDGTVSAPYKFASLAAASLYTSAADLTKFLLANIKPNQVLKPETITQMTQAETFIGQLGVYGMGPHLYSQNAEDSYVIGHDGNSNRPTVNTAARIDLMAKNGIIIMEMGSPNIASTLADEWLFEAAGIADFVVIQRNMSYLIMLFSIGALLIIIGAVVFVRRKRVKVK